MMLLFSSLRFMVNKAPDELLLFTDLIIFCKQDFLQYQSDSLHIRFKEFSCLMYLILGSVYEMIMMSSLT